MSASFPQSFEDLPVVRRYLMCRDMDVAINTFRSSLLVLTCAMVCGCAQHERRQVASETHPSPSTTDTSLSSRTSGWRPTDPAAAIQSVVYQISEADVPTLPDFEEVALADHPALLEMQARVDAAHGRWTQVGLNPNPTAGFSMQEIGNEGSAGQIGAFVSQQFITADKLELNRSAAAFEIQQAEERLAAQQLRVLTDVRSAFYSLLVAQERVTVAEELHDIAQQAVERARQLVKEQEPRTVLTQAAIEVELVAVLVENARVRREAEWRRLLAVCAQPDGPVQNVAGQLTAETPQIVWEESLQKIQQQSPELAVAVARVEQTRWALRRAEVEPIQNFTVQTGLFYDDGSNDPFASLQLSMPIPVTNQNQGGIAEAQANVVAAEQAVERTQFRLQQRLATVFARYDQARRQVERYDSAILKKAKDNLDLNRRTLDGGETTYIAVLTAQRTYAQAKLARLNALEQLWSAAVEIEGLLLSGSL